MGHRKSGACKITGAGGGWQLERQEAPSGAAELKDTPTHHHVAICGSIIAALPLPPQRQDTQDTHDHTLEHRVQRPQPLSTTLLVSRSSGRKMAFTMPNPAEHCLLEAPSVL